MIKANPIYGSRMLSLNIALNGSEYEFMNIADLVSWQPKRPPRARKRGGVKGDGADEMTNIDLTSFHHYGHGVDRVSAAHALGKDLSDNLVLLIGGSADFHPLPKRSGQFHLGPEKPDNSVFAVVIGDARHNLQVDIFTYNRWST